jgi:Rod binding domain-containing protein
MNIGSSLSSASLPMPATEKRNSASSALRTLTSYSGNATPDQHQKLVHAAQQLVSQTFFGQLLKQMREDPFRSKLFDGGRGGQMFGAMYDQKLAERMARGSGTKLVMSIVHHIERNGGRHKGPPAPVSTKAPADKRGEIAPKSGRTSPDKSNPFKNVRIHVAHDLRA